MTEITYKLMQNPAQKNATYKPFCIAVSSPSGAGKSTICKEILNNFQSFTMSVSATTRKPRKGEVDGKEYFFLQHSDFENKIKDNFFIEYADVFGNFYGTPSSFVNQTLQSGKNVLFDIDYQGVEQINQCLKSQNTTSVFDFVSIFILPPSIETLRQRLKKRGLDSDDTIESRIAKAFLEIQQSKHYNFVVINDNLNDCLNEVFAIITSQIIARRSYNPLEYKT